MTALDFISLAEAKNWLRVDFTDEDSIITMLLKSAIETVEKHTGQRLYKREESINSTSEKEELYVSPINEIISVLDEDDQPVDYVAVHGFNTTLTFEDCSNKVIKLDVGYASGCPESLKLACLNLLEYKYNNRSATDIPELIEEAIAPYRQYTW